MTPVGAGVGGLLLAAGQGSRMGRPKALLRDPYDVPFLTRAVDVLRDGGCADVTVVLGAAADEARTLLDDSVAVVVAEDWREGMGASLRAGLAALDRAHIAALVHLVDLPDVGAGVVARMVGGPPPTPATLARASYRGRPGHPVLLGADHWSAVADSATGDRGARAYLDAHEADVRMVECGDLAAGRDVDTPDDL